VPRRRRRARRDVGPSRSDRGSRLVRRAPRAELATAHPDPPRAHRRSRPMTFPYSTFDHLVVERRGPVGWLINNRPEQLNALRAAMRDEFATAWTELDADPDVRVIVHTGEGGPFKRGVAVPGPATDGQGRERYRKPVGD